LSWAVRHYRQAWRYIIQTYSRMPNLSATNPSIFFKQIIDVRESISPAELRSKDYNGILLDKIRRRIGDRCVPPYGYIDGDSLKIVSRTPGKVVASHLHGTPYYDVKCEAMVCMPSEGDRLKCTVIGKNKAGVMTILKPLHIILPKDIHEDKEFMDLLNKDDQVNVVVTGVRWDIHDKNINVIGKFVSKA
jgi:DNA-directed RNA polymerase subunit E'/Rpb7